MKSHRLFLPAIALFLLTLGGCGNRMEIPEGPTGILEIKKTPLFLERENKAMVTIHLEIADSVAVLELSKVRLVFGSKGNPEMLEGIVLNHSADNFEVEKEQMGLAYNAPFRGKAGTIELDVKLPLETGMHKLSLDFSLFDDAPLEQSFALEEVQLVFGKNQFLGLEQKEAFQFRPAIVVRSAGQDGSDTYRIPGLITTNEGTLIAVYDIRYNNSKDLQEDIDVGMSRSTDGGQSWEPMKVIMDMGEWGGRPQNLNGIGDPSVLYDHTSHTIWVAALWLSGASIDAMNWWASRPGMAPDETGQFILVKSTDDGLNWSEPINITEQIKDPDWQLLLAGPGRGITLEDGTLVFPAQFKKDIGEKAIDGGQYTCHSTIVYSKDGGQTWQIGSGAKPNTTEAQVVQLTDGSLMINMRDDLNRNDKGENNGRAVSFSRDLGKTWTPHPSSNHALPEPNCMASLIAHNIRKDDTGQRVLIFSNPNSKTERINMTIKLSLDEGNTWPEAHQVLLNEASGFGYSCITMVDEQTIGILYEGFKNLYFQKIQITELLPKTME